MLIAKLERLGVFVFPFTQKAVSYGLFLFDMTETVLPPQLEGYPIEYNLPRPLTSIQIQEIRRNTVLEARRAFDGTCRGAMDADNPPPFGEKIVEEGNGEELPEKRLEAVRKQLEVSLRYLDQSLEIDAQLCGNEHQGIPGVRLPVLRAKRRGNRCVVETRNTWGSTDYREPEQQDRLKKQFTVTDAQGQPHLEKEKYEAALAELIAVPPDTSSDMPVINEEDQLDIFDANNHFIGRAVVKEVAGNALRLHVHPGLHLKKGCFMRKRSCRKALVAHKNVVRNYCKLLGCENDMRDREGQPYAWGLEQTDLAAKAPRYFSWEPARSLSAAEQEFFGTYDHSFVQRMREMKDEEIPRGIVDDPEQSVAFALGAMGHPCHLIQGPPGTGKTMVASHLAQHFQSKGISTLILSHSNRGLDVLLLAAKKRGVAVHRGGTEAGVCDKNLQDTFIRSGLAHPRRSDFLKQGFDRQAFDRALLLYRRASQSASSSSSTNDAAPPKREDFLRPMLDETGWKKAWEDFDERKQEIIARLQQERGCVAGVTLNSLMTDEIIQALAFDVVIVDEASKGYLYEMLPALQKAGKQIIFIGDHKQLGNIEIPSHLKRFLEDARGGELNTAAEVTERKRIGKEEVEAFDQGPFQFLSEQTSMPRVMLRTNRRSLPHLVALVSHAGYGGKLKAGRIDREHPENGGELQWVDTAKRPDKFELASGSSKVNRVEAGLIARKVLKDNRKGVLTAGNFGVISMYRAQGNLIRERARTLLASDPHRDELLRLLSRNILTVDASQGSERDRVYVATTRSNPNGTIGFLEKVNRVNVGCSRARDALTIFGDSETLIEKNPDPQSKAYFRVAHEICRLRGAIHNTFSDVASQAKPEALKRQTHAARRNRERRAWKKKWKGGKETQ